MIVTCAYFCLALEANFALFARRVMVKFALGVVSGTVAVIFESVAIIVAIVIDKSANIFQVFPFIKNGYAVFVPDGHVHEHVRRENGVSLGRF